jgi:hypothetical protein
MMSLRSAIEFKGLSGKPKLPLDKLTVGAASGREINFRGWKPLPQSIFPF